MDWAGYTAIAALITLCIVLGGVVYRASGELTETKSTAKDAADSSEAAKMLAERIEKELNDHRLLVAREYVSKDALRDVETRILDAIRHLSERFDRVFTGKKEA